jgi:hypothetical protein
VVPGQAADSKEVPRVPTEKKIKKRIEGEKKVFKLRGLETTDESILRSPLFRASAGKLQSGTKRSSSPFTNSDDKENPMVPSKAARSTSNAKRREASPLVTKCEVTKTQKVPTTPSPLVPALAVASGPTALATPTPTPTPIPAAIKTEAATPVPAPIQTPTPVLETIKPEAAETADAVVPEAKQDVVDVLTKKLKAVLKGRSLINFLFF